MVLKMIKLLDNLIDQLPIILLAAVSVFFLWGIGYLILADMEYSRVFKEQCVAAGNQYVNGDCMK
jgi:hypothetical protein